MISDCTLANDFLSIAVAPLGAELQYLRAGNGSDLLWSGDAAFWADRSPVLFPIVGSATDDIVSSGDHLATMPRHGFARRNIFQLEDHTDTMCRFVLRATPETKTVYPFDFALHLTYELSANTLHVTARIENESSRSMPFGFGFHPAFRWPLPDSDGASHHVTLSGGGNPQRRRLQSDGLLATSLIPGPFVDGKLEIDETLFSDGALVFPNGSDALRYGPEGGPHLAFKFHNLPDIALWKPADAPFLCVEPWHGTGSLFGDGPKIEDRPNSTILAPDTAAEFGFSVTVDA